MAERTNDVGSNLCEARDMEHAWVEVGPPYRNQEFDAIWTRKRYCKNCLKWQYGREVTIFEWSTMKEELIL